MQRQLDLMVNLSWLRIITPLQPVCCMHYVIPEIIFQLFCFFPVAIQHCPMKFGFTLHQITFWKFETLDIFFNVFTSKADLQKKACFEMCLKFLRKSTNCYVNYRYHWAQERRVTPDTSQYRIAFSITGMHTWSQMNVPVSEVTSTE